MTTLSVADAHADFSRLISAAASTHERFEVTKDGARAAVNLGADDYDVLIKTIEVLSDGGGEREVRESMAEIGAGHVVLADEMREYLRATGRLPR